jgi:methionyl-tRNA formyltransferase
MKKIAFFGTSDRSIPILDSLKKNFELSLCVTKTDTKVGRHQESKECGVKRWASRNGVYYMEIPGFKEAETDRIIKEISDQKIELAVVCDFAFIIPYKLVEFLKGKFINIHFSLLPKYRGASPVQFALLNNEKTTGITFHLISKGMDDGDVISQYEYIIPNNITSGELYDVLFKFAGEKLPSTLKDYMEGKLSPSLQDASKVSYTSFLSHPKTTLLYKEDARIDWLKSPGVIEREIRAFNPWPISWGRIGELENNTSLLQNNLRLRPSTDTSTIMKLYSAELVNGKLKINEIQIEGRRKMSWEAFKNGYLAVS